MGIKNKGKGILVKEKWEPDVKWKEEGGRRKEEGGGVVRDRGMRRLKREECKRTEHDRSFSNWKILIGHSDWEDHSKGKEGCSKYRIDNLPKEWSPGVYELGIALYPSHQIHPVYLGQADNVRARLQCYGRNGAHFHPHFFHQFFSHRLSIFYRWTPMQTKQDALLTEARLLTTFDYAWNTSSNGVRRPHDILHQIEYSSTSTLSTLARAFLPFTHNQVGIPIQSTKPQPNSTYNFLSGIFTFTRSRPRLLQHTTPLIQKHQICGVPLPDASICTTLPVEGRKRCHQHKGMTIPASIQTKANTNGYQNVSNGLQDPPPQTPVDESITNTNICGFILIDVSTCTRQPVEGRKRCHQHKGMRIPTSIQTKANTNGYQNVSNGLQDPPPQTPVHESITYTDICGFILINGSTCTRQPVEGRKRCHQHKGMRISASIQTKANTCRYQNVNHDVQYPPQTLAGKSITYTDICGFILVDGSTCTRQPVKGRKRCHQHKGRRIPASFHHC